MTAPLIDKGLEKHFYKRTYDQDDELGLIDMKVENYQTLEDIIENETEE